jgi:hypothetical protein
MFDDIGCCRGLSENEREKTLKQFSFSHPLSTHKPSLIHFFRQLNTRKQYKSYLLSLFQVLRTGTLSCLVLRNVPTRLRRLKAHKHNTCGIKNVCKTQHITNDDVVYRKLFLFSFLKSLPKR